jgi:hypothetical protein
VLATPEHVVLHSAENHAVWSLELQTGRCTELYYLERVTAWQDAFVSFAEGALRAWTPAGASLGALSV